MKVLVLNGPNLSRLDLREKSFYGDIAYGDIETAIKDEAVKLKVDVDIRQSNDESELIGWLHQAADMKLPVIFNPAAFTHYSYAMLNSPSLPALCIWYWVAAMLNSPSLPVLCIWYWVAAMLNSLSLPANRIVTGKQIGRAHV